MFFLVALEYAVLASTFALAKKTLSYCPFMLLLTLRFTAASILLLAGAWLLKKMSWRLIWRDRWLFLLAGVLHSYLAFVLEFWALSRMTSAKASLMYATTPFIAALLSFALYGERLGKRQWLGILVATLGLVPLLLQDGAALSGSVHLADGVLLLAVISAAAAWFAVKALMVRGHHLVTVNGIAMGIGGLLCAVTGLFFYPADSALVSNWPVFSYWLAALIFVSHIVSYNLYSWLLLRYSITFMTLCGCMCPLFSALFGVWFLGEPLGMAYVVGLVALTIGLYLFTGTGGKGHKESVSE